MKTKTAWVAGATGLVGGHLLTLLNSHPDFEHVIALVRSEQHANWSNLQKVRSIVINYDELDASLAGEKVDSIFCALGTTAKKTPDKNEYHKIDVEYPLSIAKIGKLCGATSYGLVSAHGANESSFSGYLKLKGELERRLKEMQFHKLSIARPGLLKGDRQEFRLGERLAEAVTNHLPGNYRSIAADDVAAALIQEDCLQNDLNNTATKSSKQMQGAKKRLKSDIASRLS